MTARRPLVAFASVSFAYFSFVGLFVSQAPLWFASLGFSALAIGTLTSLQSATRIGIPYAWAWIADRTGQRLRWLRIAAAMAAIASLGFFAASSFGAVAVVVAALFIASAGVIPLSEAALAQWVSRGGALDAGRYGRVRLWGSVGFVVASGAAGFVLEALGMSWFPLLVALPLIALAAATWRLPETHEAPAAQTETARAFGVLLRPEVRWFFAGMFLTVLGHQALYAFFSLYLAELGYTASTIGLLWSLSVVVEVVWFWFQGRWFAHLSAHGWLVVAGLVSAVRFAVVAAFASAPVAIVIAQCTHAITFAAQHTACVDVVGRHFPGRLRGRGQALYAMIGYGASGLLAGIGGGALVEAAGYPGLFAAASLAGLAAAGCAAMALRAARLQDAAQGGTGAVR